MNKIRNGLLILVIIYMVKTILEYLNKEGLHNMEGLYVLKNENIVDSIFINGQSNYTRILFAKNEKKEISGKWYIEGNHIAFDNWNNDNGLLEYWSNDGGTVYFSLGRSLFFKPQKIYFDHNKYHYFERETKPY